MRLRERFRRWLTSAPPQPGPAPTPIGAAVVRSGAPAAAKADEPAARFDPTPLPPRTSLDDVLQAPQSDRLGRPLGPLQARLGQLTAKRTFAEELTLGRPRLLETRRGESIVKRYEMPSGMQFALRTGYEGACELVAHALSERLAIGLVPSCVRATVEGEAGYAQRWLEASTGLERGEDILVAPHQTTLVTAAERSDAALVLLMMGTRDIHAGNWLVVEGRERLALIDFAGGMIGDDWLDAYEGVLLQAIETVSHATNEALRALDDETLRELVAPLAAEVSWIDVDEAVRGALTRRDRIVERLDALVAERGRDAVVRG